MKLTSHWRTNQIIILYFKKFQLEILELLLKGCDAVQGLVRKVRTIQEFMLDYCFLHVNRLLLYLYHLCLSTRTAFNVISSKSIYSTNNSDRFHKHFAL